MYLFFFSNPSEAQVSYIKEAYADFDWGQGLAIVETIHNDYIKGNYVIQFVSEKNFNINSTNNLDDMATVLLSKGQFFCAIYFAGVNIESTDAYFIELGEASKERQTETERVWRVKFSKYSTLTPADIRLEDLINS